MFFYQRFINLLLPDLVLIFNEILSSQVNTEQLTEGIVVLLPKCSSPKFMTDFRPITLLNNDYKLFSKVLTSPLKEILLSIFGPEQACDVPGRTIFFNLEAAKTAILHYESQPREEGPAIGVEST